MVDVRDDTRPSGQGRKDDTGKRQWSLIPWDVVEDVVQVLEFGAKKYAPENWKKVPNARERYFDALMRHVLAWRSGEQNDPETGLNHLAHAGCCLMFLLWFEGRRATVQLDIGPLGSQDWTGEKF